MARSSTRLLSPRQRRSQADTSLRIARVTDMFGFCKCIKAYRGQEAFGDSHYDASNKVWLVGYTDRDGSEVETTIPAADDFQGAMISVETFFAEGFRKNYSLMAVA